MLKVLVVEDSEINFMVLESMISIYNSDVVHAHNLDQALSLLSQDEFDVIVLDIFLDDELGTDLFSRGGHPKPNITYVSCSAEAKFDNTHFRAHISKPFSNSQVEEVFSSIASKLSTGSKVANSEQADLTFKFLELYIQETLPLLKKIENQIQTSDVCQARKSVHKLLGSSALIASQQEAHQLIKELHHELQTEVLSKSLIDNASKLLHKITHSLKSQS